ncbi:MULTISPECIES: hypothetical protein [unclassified Bradyrhizobium]|uniref:hypothetical protein n=1 Tax=unclassified Bradyrhizobium TaxID=2631580 RepID=UPI001FFA909D|nr:MULTISPECIES: hypothetical protein [unclassified Bradyrhizobium]
MGRTRSDGYFAALPAHRDRPALVLASEDVDLIESTCNRAILLEEGRIAAAGTAEEILGRYLAATAEVQR